MANQRISYLNLIFYLKQVTNVQKTSGSHFLDKMQNELNSPNT